MDIMKLKDENRLRNIAEARSGALTIESKPLYFWFDLCGQCSLKCRHCGYHIHGRTSDQEVSEEVYQKVLAEIMPTAYICYVGGTNYGEMTISKNFGRFLGDCIARQVKVSLTTNGTVVADEWLDQLCEGLCEVGFSMEGMGEPFEEIRGFSWEKFYANVEKVCRRRSELGSDFRIEWRYCAHSGNIHQLPEMIRVAKDTGIDVIKVMPLIPYVAKQKYKQLFYHRSLANRYFDEARDVAAELDFEVNIPPNFSDGTFDSPGEPEESPDARAIDLNRCFLPWQTCSVNELGAVRPCCRYWRPMGDLSKQSFDAVWNGPKYRRLRKNINTNSDAICTSCRRPGFDSEDNLSAWQLLPGVKEMIRKSLANLGKRKQVTYSGELSQEYDPRVDGRSG